jgi:hypothetical protein
MGAGLTEIVLALANFRSKFSLSCCSWDAELQVADVIPWSPYEKCPTPNQRATSSRSDGFLRKVNAQHGRSQPSIFWELAFRGRLPRRIPLFRVGQLLRSTYARHWRPAVWTLTQALG